MSKMKMPTIYALFAVLLVMALPAQVPATLNYQGRILQNGQPFEGKGHFVFALYEGPDRIWTNKDLPPGAQLNDPQSAEERDAMELEVRNGVFSVVLGKADMTNNRPLLLEHFYESAQTPNRVRANMRMEVWFSPVANQTYKKLSPDIEFASVPFAQVAALAATVAKGAVGTQQIANAAVTTEKIAAGAIGTALLANGTVTTEKTAEKVSSALNPPGTILTYAGTVTDTAQLVEPVPGYLLCNGAVIDGTAFSGKFDALRTVLGTSWGDASDSNAQTVNLPDLRGMFLRGVSGLRTDRDPDIISRTAITNSGATRNNVGSVQGQATRKNGLGISDPGHTHSIPKFAGAGAGWRIVGEGGGSGRAVETFFENYAWTNTTGVTITTGDNETRPINAYVNYIIKY